MASWNVGSMRGKSSEIADVLERRHVKICCVQETRWRGEGTRKIGEGKSTYKFFWKGQQDGQGGVGILVKEELASEIIEVRRLSARVMMIRILMEHGTTRVISVYAPQVGRNEEEKEELWKTLEIATAGRSRDEKLISDHCRRLQWTRW